MYAPLVPTARLGPKRWTEAIALSAKSRPYARFRALCHLARSITLSRPPLTPPPSPPPTLLNPNPNPTLQAFTDRAFTLMAKWNIVKTAYRASKGIAEPTPRVPRVKKASVDTPIGAGAGAGAGASAGAGAAAAAATAAAATATAAAAAAKAAYLEEVATAEHAARKAAKKAAKKLAKALAKEA